MQTTRAKSVPAPIVPLLVGIVAVPTLVAFWIGGRPQLGLLWAAITVAFALVLALGGRSDTIRLLRGDEDDERTLALEFRAMTATALTLVVALGGLFLAAGVRGESGVMYAALLILAEVTHAVALGVLNRRG